MDFSGLNNNPVVFESTVSRRKEVPLSKENEDDVDPIDEMELFDLIRDIKDPEHEDLSLEALNVLALKNVTVDNSIPRVHIFFTPTVPHCSASTLIGLCIRVKLLRSLPSDWKIDVQITPGAHLQEHAVNKQLNDKERVAAALENSSLTDVVHKCLGGLGPKHAG